jgi:hypothetical protein
MDTLSLAVSGVKRTTHPEWTVDCSRTNDNDDGQLSARAQYAIEADILRGTDGYKNDNDSNDEHDDDENGDGEVAMVTCYRRAELVAAEGRMLWLMADTPLQTNFDEDGCQLGYHVQLLLLLVLEL